MTKRSTVGIMLYCPEGASKSAFSEEKYKALAECFVRSGLNVETVLYNNASAENILNQIRAIDVLLVWVNPVEEGHDRTVLDRLLVELQNSGVFVSANPETIVKIGTKRVLFDTRNLEWGSGVEIYCSFDDFKSAFQTTVKDGKPKVLKQIRGNSGDGVFKVRSTASGPDRLSVLHAKRGSSEQIVSVDELCERFRPYFDAERPLIVQEWNDNLTNGMVRCYMTRNRVVGFGYQEINALFPSEDGAIGPGKRFYFTERCALFADLRRKMEDRWIGELISEVGLAMDKLPIIWDADFFINSMEPDGPGRYTLCEINVSSVSPFPESAIPAIVDETRKIVAGKDRSQ